MKVVRKQPLSQGGGKAKAQVNVLSLVTQGDESVNIRLFDGDVINVGPHGTYPPSSGSALF